MSQQFNYLGRSNSIPTKDLDTFPAPSVQSVTFSSGELTSHCPVTNQPDFYHIEVEYSPRLLCVESKSLKLYLQTFRDTAQFAESLAAEIMADIDRVLSPARIRVTLIQQVRGGLQLTVTAEADNE